MDSSSGRLPRRISVVGLSGSGKTTVARQLARLADAPHVELDALHWIYPDWSEPSDAEFAAAVEHALAGDAWVVEGNYRKVRAVYWSRVEMLVWLDLPLWVITWRVLRRTLRRVRSSERLWGTQRESVRRAFLSYDSLWLWNIRTHRRRQRLCGKLGAELEHRGGQAVRLRSQRDVDRWLSRLANQKRSDRQEGLK
ncbi:MAG: adenylate kinase [Chloroflexi bacterium]|nr:adenylate kinase [Chloroflexota bacterium]